METLERFGEGEKCIFCKENVVDELLFGKIYKYEDVITHYFCMLFSAEVEQNGNDDEGILGFLPVDIKKEVKRGEKATCTYCHHTGGTINCHLKSCKKKFHYACGVENGSLHQFFDTFKSFCVSHRKVQNVPQSACKLTEKSQCMMCYEEVTPKPSLKTIWAPCCKTAWLHRPCVQKMAVSAGYFFRCPKCNNKDEFRREMLECGIYIPDQDASWEMEPNAFEELAERYKNCDADQCACPEGRSYARIEGPWEMILCILCGSQGIHAKCGRGKLYELRRWTCPTCSSVTNKSPTVSETIEQPGPSNLRPNLPEQVESTAPSERNRRPGRRKRIGSDDEDDLSKKKKKITDSMSSEDSDSSPSQNYIGNPLSIALCNASRNLIDDSDENESDVEANQRSTARLEAPAIRREAQPAILRPARPEASPVILRPSSTVQSNGSNLKLAGSRRTCDTVIDLLDSDDEVPSQSDCGVTSTSKDDLIDADNDDVIFVCNGGSNANDDIVMPSSTALLRFVDNNRVFIVSPAQIKQRGGIENLTSTYSTSENRDSPRTTNGSATEENDPPRPTTATPMWQSIPLHKSVVHSFAASQDLQGSKNNGERRSSSYALDRKNWPSTSTEVIYID